MKKHGQYSAMQPSHAAPVPIRLAIGDALTPMKLDSGHGT